MNTAETPNNNPNNDPSNNGESGAHAAPNLEKALGSIYANLSDENKTLLAKKAATSEDIRATLASMEAGDLGALIAESPETAEQYEAIIQGMLAASTQEVATKAPGTDLEVAKSKEVALPSDFDQFDYDDAVAAAAEKPKLDIGWQKGAGFNINRASNWASFKESMKARRQYRLSEKTKGMNDAERAEYMKNYDRRRKLGKVLAGYAAAAVVVGYFAYKAFGVTKGVEVATGHGGGNIDHAGLGQEAHNGDFRAAEEAHSQNLDYDNSDSSFYDFAHKDFHGDFGPPLQASEKDGNMGAGFNDWMTRHNHNPNGLANLVSGLGLEGHGDSIADRNELGDMLDGNINEQMRLDKLVEEALKDPKQFKVETINIDFPYDTTYEVDNNGDPMIATQQNVNHGGQAFKVTNAATGEETFWRKNCGGDQQIWPHHSESVSYAPQGGGEQPTHGSTVPGTPRTPGTPGTPGTPEYPDTPETPDTPDTPETPETPEVPSDAKDYSGGVDTADGIDPSKNGFVGWTPDASVNGNGTGSQNLDPSTVPGSSNNHQADGAAANTDPQVGQQEAGAGTNRSAEDAARQAQNDAAESAQKAANERASKAAEAANSGGSAGQDQAVRDAQSGIGADGRPTNASSASTTN